MRASAYLSIFDDWELLASSLASIFDRVEEIVVVDGAYRWMAPLFAADGRDPTSSCPEVQAALAPFAAKLRVISGLWENETAKRIAGFEACRQRYVYRVDADEVLFFDDAEIERFLAAPQGIAEMAMPIALAPDLIRTRPGQSIERQSFLFDRERIGAAEHCSYLWLILPAAERARLPPQRGGMVHETPIAFNAHLTQWRPPRTAINRARFYDMNYLREKRTAPWLAGLGFAPQPDLDDDAWFAALFQRVSPSRFTGRLVGHPTTLGFTGLDGFGVGPTPLRPDQQNVLTPLFATQIAALARLNRTFAVADRVMPTQSGYAIDLSSEAARAALGPEERVVIQFDDAVERCAARLEWLSAAAPFQRVRDVPFEIAADEVRLTLPEQPPAGSFRCILRLWVQTAGSKPLIGFRTVV